MRDFLTDMSLNKIAIITGVAFLFMLFLGILGLPLYQNLLVPGDETTSITNIMANLLLFRLGIASYLIILILDVIVAVGLYMVFKQVNKNLALLQMWLRLLYTAIALISLIVLVMLFINAYNIAQLIAYTFFIPHIFVLGILVFKSDFFPKPIGILVIIASFCYLILIYGEFLLPQNLYEASFLIVILIAIIGEISVGIGLLWKGLRNEIPEMKS
ncbi:MAG: DUF4386 domain-containing protein [Candidatus Sifarchaeia archaeon]|jgi:hypothetical protein